MSLHFSSPPCYYLRTLVFANLRIGEPLISIHLRNCDSHPKHLHLLVIVTIVEILDFANLQFATLCFLLLEQIATVISSSSFFLTRPLSLNFLKLRICNLQPRNLYYLAKPQQSPCRASSPWQSHYFHISWTCELLIRTFTVSICIMQVCI